VSYFLFCAFIYINLRSFHLYFFRLLKYDTKTSRNEVLIDGLHFANGVVLSPKGDFVLVAETVRSRIHRYYVKGPKKGSRDIFIDGLPGLPDNLKSDGQGGFLVPLITVRDKGNPVLFQSLGPFPVLRKFMARVLALLEMSVDQIDQIYPNNYAKRLFHWIGHFESVNRLAKKGAVVLQLDADGNIKHSYHNTDGSLSGIGEAHWFDGAFFLGSPYNMYVGRVKLSFAESQKVVQKQKPEKQKKQQSEKQQQEPSTSQQHEHQNPPPQQQQQKLPQQQQQQLLQQQQEQEQQQKQQTLPQQQEQKPPASPSLQQQKPPPPPTTTTTTTTK
jgi:hypothetical protein